MLQVNSHSPCDSLNSQKALKLCEGGNGENIFDIIILYILHFINCGTILKSRFKVLRQEQYR